MNVNNPASSSFILDNNAKQEKIYEFALSDMTINTGTVSTNQALPGGAPASAKIANWQLLSRPASGFARDNHGTALVQGTTIWTVTVSIDLTNRLVYINAANANSLTLTSPAVFSNLILRIWSME